MRNNRIFEFSNFFAFFDLFTFYKSSEKIKTSNKQYKPLCGESASVQKVGVAIPTLVRRSRVLPSWRKRGYEKTNQGECRIPKIVVGGRPRCFIHPRGLSTSLRYTADFNKLLHFYIGPGTRGLYCMFVEERRNCEKYEKFAFFENCKIGAS